MIARGLVSLILSGVSLLETGGRLAQRQIVRWLGRIVFWLAAMAMVFVATGLLLGSVMAGLQRMPLAPYAAALIAGAVGWLGAWILLAGARTIGE